MDRDIRIQFNSRIHPLFKPLFGMGGYLGMGNLLFVSPDPLLLHGIKQ